jgi:hypothetical protein
MTEPALVLHRLDQAVPWLAAVVVAVVGWRWWRWMWRATA